MMWKTAVKISMSFLLVILLSACNTTPSELTPTHPPVLDAVQSVEPTAQPFVPTTPTVLEAHPPNPTPPPTLEPSPLLSLIKAELVATNCSPPCMFNIFPGQTKADEVPAILESLKAKEIVEDYYLTQNPQRTSYIASFYGYPLSITITIDETANIVLAVGSGMGHRVITFADVINRFGEPDLVIPTADTSYYNLFLAYVERRIRLEVRSDYLYDELVSPDMAVKNIVYETPEIAVNSYLAQPPRWMPWEGFKRFDYYFWEYDQLKAELDSLSDPEG